MIRVILVDDNPDFREWLRALLDGSAQFQVVGEAASGDEATDLVARLRPTLVIVDLFLGDASGLDVVRTIHAGFPEIESIVISIDEEGIYETLAREAGALAFIPKARLSLEAINRALTGNG
ncbi:MAG: response regulator transcription factor [Chloroflexi bacterium]|nr:response regulator transcription factor [Chloroflexota bacterium]